MPRTHIKYTLIPFFLKVLTLLITATCRVRWHNQGVWQAHRTSDKPYILGMWHNCSTICSWAMRDSGVTVMVSDSRDGEYVARLANLFGIDTVRGSSSKGAKKAIRSALQLLSKQQAIAVTPDGPRGPKYSVQSGILWFSAAGQAPIIPLHIESSRQWVLNSWDGHCFPKPFSTIHISFGEPQSVTRQDLENDMEASTARLQASMMDNVASVQRAIKK